MDLRALLNWKAVGVAGLVGVVATGVVLVRDERQRRAYTADDVRARLHARAATAAPVPTSAEPGDRRTGPWRRRGRR
ncbi:MAG: hypothetical protein M3513_18990 [Actinomycetota bacterium]|nr:hypothetical protein [Actinomycetota bacterium]